ncbi:hypothetical protein HMPREF9945_03128 [Clostridioides difficile 70-100-2010]|nr:hypothetical protein HMPREF9945_03128 [Clostridioides difficile 70-100-2010]EQK58216.1 hypothetical protein C676_3178 [Clostridioides difficile F548]
MIFFNQILSSTPFLYFYRYIYIFPENVLNIQIIRSIMLLGENV